MHFFFIGETGNPAHCVGGGGAWPRCDRQPLRQCGAPVGQSEASPFAVKGPGAVEGEEAPARVLLKPKGRWTSRGRRLAGSGVQPQPSFFSTLDSPSSFAYSMRRPGCGWTVVDLHCWERLAGTGIGPKTPGKKMGCPPPAPIPLLSNALRSSEVMPLPRGQL